LVIGLGKFVLVNINLDNIELFVNHPTIGMFIFIMVATMKEWSIKLIRLVMHNIGAEEIKT
jgi:hypothetical protein